MSCAVGRAASPEDHGVATEVLVAYKYGNPDAEAHANSDPMVLERRERLLQNVIQPSEEEICCRPNRLYLSNQNRDRGIVFHSFADGGFNDV